ncbi:NADH dehydrogenase (ubiquinone) 1 alpha subcomplex subunit 2, partial [Tremellales sp. Uapishka_1]
MSFAKQIPAAVKEIRLHLCQTSQASQGVRSFIQSTYPSIKSARPDLKVLIREASGVEPRAFVRFERGIESQTALSDLSEKDVGSALSHLINSQTVGKA